MLERCRGTGSKVFSFAGEFLVFDGNRRSLGAFLNATDVGTVIIITNELREIPREIGVDRVEEGEGGRGQKSPPFKCVLRAVGVESRWSRYICEWC